MVRIHQSRSFNLDYWLEKNLHIAHLDISLFLFWTTKKNRKRFSMFIISRYIINFIANCNRIEHGAGNNYVIKLVRRSNTKLEMNMNHIMSTIVCRIFVPFTMKLCFKVYKNHPKTSSMLKIAPFNSISVEIFLKFLFA